MDSIFNFFCCQHYFAALVPNGRKCYSVIYMNSDLRYNTIQDISVQKEEIHAYIHKR